MGQVLRFGLRSFVLVGVLLAGELSAATPDWWNTLPPAGQNNLWYARNQDSRTVFIFIHGIFSNSRTCWLYESPDKDPNKSMYWPMLVANEWMLRKPSVYLAGFYTKLDSGRYDMVQAAQELIDALNRDRVLEKRDQIVFVGHSTGGIMARYLLTHHSEQFVGKKIGLLLMASPSMGSKLANLGHVPAKFIDQQLGMQLEWNSPFLVQLDRDFRTLLHDKKTLEIEGREVLEQKFVIDSKFFPTRTVVVEESSGSRYFGAPRMIGGSDHHSIVKPLNAQDPVHKTLVGFFMESISLERKKSPAELQAQLREADRAIEVNPKDAFAYRKRGEAYLGLEKYENALQAYSRSIELYPEHYAAVQERAIVYGHLKRFDEAIADITQAQKILPDAATPYTLRGMFRQDAAARETDPARKKAGHEAALEDLAMALRLQSNIGFVIHPLRAKSLEALGRTEEARLERAKIM